MLLRVLLPRRAEIGAYVTRVVPTTSEAGLLRLNEQSSGDQLMSPIDVACTAIIAGLGTCLDGRLFFEGLSGNTSKCQRPRLTLMAARTPHIATSVDRIQI